MLKWLDMDFLKRQLSWLILCLSLFTQSGFATDCKTPLETVSKLVLFRTLEGRRAHALVTAIESPETSPILQTCFPEAYQGGFSPRILFDSLSTEIQKRSKGRDPRGIRLGDLVPAFFGSIESAAEVHANLRRDKSFKDFVSTVDGTKGLKTLDNPHLVTLLNSEGASFKALRKRLPELYCGDGTISNYSDETISTADKKAREILASVEDSKDLVKLMGYIELYKNKLEKENSWNAALNLNPLALASEREYPSDSFTGKKLYANDSVYEVQSLIGKGGENHVYRVKNLTTGKTKILKVTSTEASVNPNGLYEGQQKIKAGGMPIVEMEPVSKNFTFVEEIKTFGSDVIRNYLTSPTSTDLNGLTSFYQKLVREAKLRIRDLKPANLGRRDDGTWVITDWAFNLDYREKGMALEGNISKDELAALILNGIESEYNKVTELSPSQKGEFQIRAKGLAEKLFRKIDLPMEAAFKEFNRDINQ
jgi:hypothetical protein